jgi:NIMA (never in mitosis gene a)-related kinase
MILGGLNEKERQSAYNEAKLLKELNHPNIVKYKDSFNVNDNLIIIMEYCEGN